MIQYQIEVSKSDIEQGLQSRCSQCPIALAVRRVVGYADVYVSGVGKPDGGEVSIIPKSVGKNCVAAKLPESARLWAELFDRRGPAWVTPFSFVLEVPE